MTPKNPSRPTARQPDVGVPGLRAPPHLSPWGPPPLPGPLSRASLPLPHSLPPLLGHSWFPARPRRLQTRVPPPRPPSLPRSGQLFRRRRPRLPRDRVPALTAVSPTGIPDAPTVPGAAAPRAVRGRRAWRAVGWRPGTWPGEGTWRGEGRGVGWGSPAEGGNWPAGCGAPLGAGGSPRSPEGNGPQRETIPSGKRSPAEDRGAGASQRTPPPWPGRTLSRPTARK